MELRDARLSIVGLGLIGGSAALRLRGRCRSVLGVEPNPRSAELARQAGIEIRELGPALSEADLVVLATPVREILQLLERFQSSPPAAALVMDFGSTKREVVRAMEALPAELPAIGGHPLCGKESAGFEHAEPDLFQGRRFVLTPCSRTTPAAQALAEQLVAALGARPLEMSPARHDRLLAATSHLPYLLAVALVASAASTAQEDPGIWEVAAAGFLSTSRLAGSDPRMMIDILQTNRELTLAALANAEAELGRLRSLLQAGAAEGPLREYLQPVQDRRAELKGRPAVDHGA